MIIIELLEILEGLAILQRITSIAWLNQDAQSQYREFREEIATLEKNLNELHDVVRGVQNAPESRNQIPMQKSPAIESLTRVLGGFQDTLNDCWILLDRWRAYGESRGPISNLQWHLLVKDDLAVLRDRIAVHNIKLSMALSCWNITSFDNLRKLILSTTEWLGRQIHHEQCSPETCVDEGSLLSECRSHESLLAVSVADLIPVPISDTLVAIMEGRHGNLNAIPLADGVDEAVFHLDQATKTAMSHETDHVHTIASILRAYWLLKATQLANEYQAAVTHPSFVKFEAQLAKFGMTLPLFFARLEDRILLAHQRQTALREKSKLVSIEEIRDRIEKDRHRWLEHRQSGSRRDSLDPRRGKKVMKCQLYCLDDAVKKQVEVYQNGEASLNLITNTGGSDNMIYKTDLHLVHFGAHPSANLGGESYPVTIKQNRMSKIETPDTITFLQPPDLFTFQELVTGFKVVDNLPGARVTCQFSRGDKKWVLWKGSQRTERARVQLWSSSNRQDSTHAPIIVNAELKTNCDVHIQDSGHFTPTTCGPDSRAASPQFIPLQDGNFGTILEVPECPRLVIFLPDMLLVIKVNDDVKIRPDRCRCGADEASNGSECKEVVIKSISRYINARSTTADPIAGYNIASAGQYQRGTLKRAEKLTLVTIEFGSVEERMRFAENFDALKELHRLNRRSSRQLVS